MPRSLLLLYLWFDSVLNSHEERHPVIRLVIVLSTLTVHKEENSFKRIQPCSTRKKINSFLKLIASQLLPYMLHQIVLVSKMHIWIMNSHTCLQYPIKSMKGRLAICMQWYRRAPLIILILIVMTPLICIPLILNNHIMQNNASIYMISPSISLCHTCSGVRIMENETAKP
jgi:hypothetical protein